MKKNNKKIILSLACVLIVFSALLIINAVINSPQTQKGNKQYQLTVCISADEVRHYELRTDEEYLGNALKEAKLISGEETQYGMFVTVVDGVEANSKDLKYWFLQKDGETLTTGVDQTPVNDGDKFEFILQSY